MGFFDLFSSRRRKKRSRPRLKFDSTMLLSGCTYYIQSIAAIRHFNLIYNLKQPSGVKMCFTYSGNKKDVRAGLLDTYYIFDLYAVYYPITDYRLDTDYLLTYHKTQIGRFHLTATEVSKFIKPFPTTPIPSSDVIRSLDDLYTL